MNSAWIPHNLLKIETWEMCHIVSYKFLTVFVFHFIVYRFVDYGAYCKSCKCSNYI